MKQSSVLEASDDAAKACISDFVRGFSIETTPAGARRVGDFRSHLADGTRVYVTSLPGSDFREVVTTCEKLASEHMIPVPHFTARSIPSTAVLDERLDMVTSQANVRHVLAIAGSSGSVAGSFPDTISMLETGAFTRYGIRAVDVAGHPEGVPGLDAGLVRDHELRKLAFARASGLKVRFVTQFVFDARPVIDFTERLRSSGVDLPLVVGLPGPAKIQSLLRYAKTCGVGPSIRFLAQKSRDLRRLLTVQAPDKTVTEIAKYRYATGPSGITGVHIFPFGGFEQSAAWAVAVAEGDIDLDRSGFTVVRR